MAAPQFDSSFESSDGVSEFSLSFKEHKEVLQTHHPTILDLLNLDQIFPFLNEKNLLTDSEQEKLLPDSRYTNRDKISILVNSLPKKGSRALYHFIVALRSSSDGTAHGELADILQNSADEAVARRNTFHKGRVSCMWIIVIVIAILLLALIVFWYYTPSHIVASLRYYQNLPYSKSLPLQPENFVGRDEEMNSLEDFMKSNIRITSIIGGPGFGKSALALSFGHQIVSRGVTVYYVDMTEVTSMQALAEKIIEGDKSIVSIRNITVERMYKWARQLYHNTLLILDNCDEILNQDLVKEELQTSVIKLLESSKYLKILTTSRKVILLSTFHLKSFQLNELKADTSCELLKRYSEHLTTTECKRVAYLTGNAPLALKVVGSLLEQPNPPDIATVIENLDKQLIRTLSPNELPVEERVNACISVSYQYLSPSVRLIGQYLAHFPGSFSLDTAKGIFGSNKYLEFDYNDVSNAVDELIQRSLLQKNQLAKRTAKDVHNRVQFHRLIKEFFLEVQWSRRKKETYFSYGFVSHFSFELWNVDSVDEERHNFLHYIHLLSLYCARRDDVYIDQLVRMGIHTVGHLFDENILQYYYTSSELYGPTQHIVNYLATNCSANNKERYQDCLDFVTLLLQLAKFDEDRFGISQAVNLLKFYQYKVDDIMWRLVPNPFSTVHCVQYIKFYQQLGGYYRTLEYYEKEKECHEKILRANKELRNCEPGSCQYYSIGNAYHNIGKYSEALYFFELALKEEHLDPIQRGSVLVNIHLRCDDQQRQKAIVQEVVDLFPSLIGASNSNFLKHFVVISSIVKLYRDEGRMEEADTLEAKQLTAINEAAVSEYLDKSELIVRAKALAKSSCKARRYSRCVEMAELTLKLQVEEGEMIAMLELMADAKRFSGNHSECYAILDQIVNYIYEHNKSDEYFYILCKICLNHGYFRCSVDCISKVASKINSNIILIIFLVPPDIDYLDYLVMSEYAETSSSVRQSTDLVYQQSLQPINHALQNEQSSHFRTLLTSLELLWHFLLKFVSVRGFIIFVFRAFLILCYVLSIIIRLYIAYFIVRITIYRCMWSYSLVFGAVQLVCSRMVYLNMCTLLIVLAIVILFFYHTQLIIIPL